MNRETVSSSETKLYRERAYETAERDAKYLEQMENGTLERVELDPEETKQVVGFENGLGKELKEIYKDQTPARDLTMYPEYFTTDAGKKSLAKALNPSAEKPEISPELQAISTIEDAEKFMAANTGKLVELSGDDREILSKLAGDSYNHVVDRFSKPLVEACDEDPALALEKLDEIDFANPVRQRVQLEPEALNTRIENLREFKQKLKKEYDAIKDSDQKTDKSKRILLNMYSKHVNNELSWVLYPKAFNVVRKSELIGYENLSEAEKKVIETIVPASSSGEKWNEAKKAGNQDEYLAEFGERSPRKMHMLDKLRFGASAEKVDDPDSPHHRSRQQVDSKVLAKAEAVQEYFAETLPQKLIESEHFLDQAGWDREKIMKNKISAEKFIEWANKIMKHLGLDEEDWKARASAATTTIYVSSPKKELVATTNYQARLENAVPTLRHEMTHVNQAYNRSHITGENKLELLTTHGYGQSSIYAEGGATHAEADLAGDMFGRDVAGNQRLVFVLAERLKGGSFQDCFKAMHKPNLEIILANAKAGLHLNKEETKDIIKKAIRDDFSYSTRPFYGVMGMEKDSPYIGSSLGSFYLEGELLREELAKKGLPDYMQSGLSADNLLDLYQAGLAKNPRENLVFFSTKDIIDPIRDDLEEYRQEGKPLAA